MDQEELEKQYKAMQEKQAEIRRLLLLNCPDLVPGFDLLMAEEPRARKKKIIKKQ